MIYYIQGTTAQLVPAKYRSVQGMTVQLVLARHHYVQGTTAQLVPARHRKKRKKVMPTITKDNLATTYPKIILMLLSYT